MRLTPNRRWQTIAVSLGLLFIPIAESRAQFIGGIVHDPINWAQLSGIWGSQASTLSKIIQELRLATQMYQHAMYMENMVNAARRQSFITSVEQAVNIGVHNKYGESIYWPMMVNGRPDLASAAWQNSTIDVLNRARGINSTPQLGSNSAARLASIEIADGAAQQCVAQAAGYRQNFDANAGAVGALWAAIQDDTKGMNAEIQQLNLGNAAATQASREARSQGMLHACEVQQQAVQLKMERDKLAEAENFEIQEEQATKTVPTAWGNSASTIANW